MTKIKIKAANQAYNEMIKEQLEELKENIRRPDLVM